MNISNNKVFENYKVTVHCLRTMWRYLPGDVSKHRVMPADVQDYPWIGH